jgi:hypothetical protein
MKDEFDFGFTLQSEHELQELENSLRQEVSATKEVLRRQLRGLKSLYAPLLDNLARDPDKAIIRWPNRAEKIAEFNARVDQYIEQCLKSID